MKSLLILVWLVIIGLAVVLSSCDKKPGKERIAFLVVWPKGWESLVLPISHCTFYASKVDSLKHKMWYIIVNEDDLKNFKDTTDWSSSISSPEDAGPYTPTKRDSLEWGLKK